MKLILLHGNHSFLRKRIKEEIIEDYLKSTGNNVNMINISDINQKVIEAKLKQKLATDSLFAEKELIVICLNQAAKTTREKSKTANSEKLIIPYLDNLPPGISLLLEVPIKLPKSSLLLKIVSKNGGNIQLLELPPAKDKSAILQAVKEFLANEKVSIDRYLVNQLIDASQGDWWYIFTGLAQAALLIKSQDKKEDNEQVAQLWDLPEEKSIFRLFDAIGKGDQAQAFSILYENLSQDKVKAGSDVESVLGITSLIARQFRQMLAVKDNISVQEGQKEWQIPAFAYAKLKFQASFFSFELLMAAYGKLADIQEKAKSGLYSPLSLVDFFVIYLISHRQQSVGNIS